MDQGIGNNILYIENFIHYFYWIVRKSEGSFVQAWMRIIKTKGE